MFEVTASTKKIYRSNQTGNNIHNVTILIEPIDFSTTTFSPQMKLNFKNNIPTVFHNKIFLLTIGFQEITHFNKNVLATELWNNKLNSKQLFINA